MPPPEDTPTVRWPWLDGWLAPPWRALLTWIVLSASSAAILNTVGWNRFFDWSLFLLYRVPHVTLSGEFQTSVMLANLALLSAWFEPLTLQLSLPRSACWLSLRVVSFVGVFLLPQNEDLRGAAKLFLPAAGMMLVLWGWRSRPWMALVGGALSFLVFEILIKIPDFSVSIMSIGFFYFPYAVVLLFGTRLLSPEERENAARDRCEGLEH